MVSNKDIKKRDLKRRLNSRIFMHQSDFIAAEIKKTGMTEGEVLRMLLDEAIINRKAKK